MINYFITDSTGLVVKTGTCQKENLEANTGGLGTVHIGIAPHGRHRFDGTDFTSVEPQSTYSDERKLQYPPIQDLADAIYWQSKGDNTKMEAYLAQCTKVKEDIPKPV